MKFESVSPLVLDSANWKKTLPSIRESDAVYFLQRGTLPEHRHEEALREFLNPRAYGDLFLRPSSLRHDLPVTGLGQKNEQLNGLASTLARDSRLEPKLDAIVAVMEEIVLNALISAPRAAEIAGIAARPGTAPLFGAEWTEDEIWLHGQDPFGAFRRENFQKSFRAPGFAGPTSHGHSGKGLEIILNSSTDLYVKSRPDWGTWVSARIDLRLSNKDNGSTPKRLLLDFT